MNNEKVTSSFINSGKKSEDKLRIDFHEPNDVIFFFFFFAFTKMGDSQKLSAKIHLNFAINLHIFWFDFSKAINLYW